MNTAESWSFFYADDDENDRLLMEIALERLGTPFTLVLADDGRNALDKLAAGPLPKIALFDLKMPRMNGLEAIAELRKRPEFAGVFVVMFSSSSHARDIGAAHALGANGYMIKPSAPQDLVVLLKALTAAVRVAGTPAGWLEFPGNQVASDN
jgi:CheY-like chemotaxis protein